MNTSKIDPAVLIEGRLSRQITQCGGQSDRSWLFRLGSAGVAATVLACLAAANVPNALAQEAKEKPVAVVGGEKMYETDYFPRIQSQVQKIRMEEYALRRRALEDAVNKKLLKVLAEKKGVTELEWLRTEIDSKVEPASEEEIDQELVNRMFNSSGQMAEDRDEIGKQLNQDLILQARDEYFQGLRKREGVKIYLLPPTVEVGYDSKRVRGNPDAPITIIEFSDFHCPYCEQVYGVINNILKKYDGKVKLAYRDLPLLQADAALPSSAEAARCAGEQGKFWEFHDLLFENQDFYHMAEFQKFAESLKMDGASFTACMASGKFKEAIKADFQEGVRLGITGTPGFFINGVFLGGAHPQSDFEEIIDAELALM